MLAGCSFSVLAVIFIFHSIQWPDLAKFCVAAPLSYQSFLLFFVFVLVCFCFDFVLFIFLVSG